MNSSEIIHMFSDIMCESYGICGFISHGSTAYLLNVLSDIDNTPLTKVQFDQLLSLQNIQTVSDDFFDYYWLSIPTVHFYKVEQIELSENKTISSLEQLKWGFNRLFIDCLFVYGNIQRGFDSLARLNRDEINSIFIKYCFDTDQIINRGNTLHFELIDKKDRYLISEMACKTLTSINSYDGLVHYLKNSYREAQKNGVNNPHFKDILEGKYYSEENNSQLSMFSQICFEDIMDDPIHDENEIDAKATSLAEKYQDAHNKALINTNLYLSLVNDLDVYVATSMRERKNFIDMADFCERIFKSSTLNKFDLRYFDPTISAADSHEDKGLIECLMVKSARMLIYHTGKNESYGKDVEAAMALCLGKPTIFYCSGRESKARFFKDIHPLSRLVNFTNGVAGGAIVCINEQEVISIVYRLITNSMEYQIKKKTGTDRYYMLEEKLTGSTVRIQTHNDLLSSAFWNNYTL